MNDGDEKGLFSKPLSKTTEVMNAGQLALLDNGRQAVLNSKVFI